MPKRDFLALPDLSKTELSQLFDLAGQMKSGKYRNRPLEGQSLAMVFAKSSTRTRVSFPPGTFSWVAANPSRTWRGSSPGMSTES